MSAPDALPPPAILGRGLALRRGERLLFDDLEFNVGGGEVLLLRGPNGVGKTSLLLAIAGALPLAGGYFSFVGRDAEIRPGTDMHLVGHRTGLKPRLTVAENLRFWAELYAGHSDRVAQALDRVGLGDLKTLDAGHLSAGQQKRLSLARLLVADRRIWLLDEPTAALDRAGEQLVGQLVSRHRETRGMAIIATHHDIPMLQGNGISSLDVGGPPT